MGAEAFERCYPPQILNGSLTSPIRNVSDSAETYFFCSNHRFFVGMYFVASLLLFNSTIYPDLQITKNFELDRFLAMQVM